MQRIRRILAVILVAMTVLSCNVTGFAAVNNSTSKPTITVTKKVSSVKRGKKAVVKFRLSSGSFYKTSFYRSAWAYVLAPGSIAPGKTAAGISKSEVQKFNGYGTASVNIGSKLPKYLARGKYRLVCCTFYRNQNKTTAWTLNKNSVRSFIVTVK